MKKKDTTSDEGSAWGSAPAGRITPQDVQQKEFRVARFGAGYRMREVDEFLDQVTDAMSALVAESERLRRGSADRGSASGRPSASASLPASADDAGRTAVDAFLRREKGFLQDLGGLVQTHAEELRSMVREVRRDAPASAADTSPIGEPAIEPAPTLVSSPEASPGPSPDASTELDAPQRRSPRVPSSEQRSRRRPRRRSPTATRREMTRTLQEDARSRRRTPWRRSRSESMSPNPRDQGDPRRKRTVR